jgi:hypothetical protein
MSSLRKLEPKRRDMCDQLNGDCQESRPSPLNKVRTHRRHHEVDLHYTRSPATGPRSARHGLCATEIAKALGSAERASTGCWKLAIDGRPPLRRPTRS